jgi:DNA-binding LacI/PurR family transcriptional regulator
MIPQRVSIIDQTATVLRGRLDCGEWHSSLPGEIQLASELQVGRNTVRSALAILESEGRLSRRNGRRRAINGQPSKTGSNKRRVILLLSRPVGEFTPSTILWIAETQNRLESIGWQFQLSIEPAAYRNRPSACLNFLTAGAPGAVWILHRSTVAMQRWFQDQGLRAVLAGSRHIGITLPQVDADLRAVSRHAAGQFVAYGHRDLAILRPDDAFAGDSESVAGFQEGARGALVRDIQFPNEPRGVIRAVGQLLQSSKPPTGLYILHPEHCVTAISHLLRQGIAVPGRLSVICRDDEPYLVLLTPEPTRYRRNPQAMASKLASLVTRPTFSGKSIRIMPISVPGETLSRK